MYIVLERLREKSLNVDDHRSEAETETGELFFLSFFLSYFYTRSTVYTHDRTGHFKVFVLTKFSRLLPRTKEVTGQQRKLRTK